MKRVSKVVVASVVAALIGYWLSQVLGMQPPKALLTSILLVLAAGGTVLLVCRKDGKLERPKLLLAIIGAALAACIAIIAVAWYALAHSTDL